MNRTPLDAWIQSKIGAGSGQVELARLRAHQLERLNAALRLARTRTRFYAGHLSAAPARLERLEDLSLLPFTTADDLRTAGASMVGVSQGEIERIVTLDTSGTTGSPKRVYFTQADQELTVDFFRHGMATFTAPGDRVLILLPFERPGSVGDLLSAALRRLEAIPMGYGPVKDPLDALAIIETRRVNVIVAAPAHALALARYSKGPAQSAWRPGRVLLSTDHVPVAITHALATAWGAEVYNHYGMTEMGLGGGVECQAHRGYHLREADLYFEIVDPASGRPAASGEMGEVVFTTLTRTGMPLIRYRTGDLSRFLPEPCPCGSALPSLERITRRLAAPILTAPPGDESPSSPSEQPPAGMSICMADLDEALFPLPVVLNFSADITRHERRDRLEIDLVCRPGAPANVLDQARQALQALPAVQAAGTAFTIEIRAHDYQPATAGSLAKRVIHDLRG